MLTRLDFTTILGAINVIDNDTKFQIEFGDIINLSQLVESIVLHHMVTFELGTDSHWAPFRNLFYNSQIGKLINEHCNKNENIFSIHEQQIDQDEQIVAKAIQWIIDNYEKIDKRALQFSIGVRPGLYGVVKKIEDKNNPTVERYFKIARDISLQHNQKINDVLLDLNSRGIGKLGIHVLVRTCLLAKEFKNNSGIIYSPHFSRQKLAYNLLNENLLKGINDFHLNEITYNLIQEYQPNNGEKNLKLSPILIACLVGAKNPIDIINNAIKIRNLKSTRNYRNFCNDLYESGPAKFSIYKKHNISLNQQINEILKEKLYGKKINVEGHEYSPPWVISIPHLFPELSDSI